MLKRWIFRTIIVLLLIEFVPAFFNYERDSCGGKTWEQYDCSHLGGICDDYKNDYIVFFEGWHYACTDDIFIYSNKEFPQIMQYDLFHTISNGISDGRMEMARWEIRGSLSEIVYFRKTTFDYYITDPSYKRYNFTIRQLFPKTIVK